MTSKKDCWKPVCKTENRDLGGRMTYEEAKKIAQMHELDHPTHVVGVLKCI